MPLLLGLDVGTSSTKALVLDARGVIRSSGSAGHPTRQPRPGWSEQDPQDWWRSSCAAARDAIAGLEPGNETIAAVGLSGQMHGSVLVDRPTIDSRGEGDDVLRPALLWNDQRTAEQCRQIEAAAGGREALVRLVGNAALPGFTLPKLLWVRQHEPRLWERVAALMMPKDYVRFRMTGQVATDVGDAAGTLLLDVDHRAWSHHAAERFGIDRSILPPIHEAGAVCGHLTPTAAAALRLRPGTPVVAGSGDNQCGAIGAGVVEPGLILATLGTSGVIYAHARTPRRDLGVPGAPPGRVHTMCAADGDAGGPGHWSITGCTLSAAGALAWARSAVFGGIDYETLFAEAATAPPGCDGLLFLPYLTGERCPHPDPAASAAWIGLTSRHTRGHLVRAILEGVAMTMGEILSIMRSIGVEARVCRLGGGGTRSPLWREILVAALGVRTESTETEEGPAFGAALLAGVGIGMWRDVPTACCQTIRTGPSRDPDPRLIAAHSVSSPIFAGAYRSLQQAMGGLATARTTQAGG